MQKGGRLPMLSQLMLSGKPSMVPSPGRLIALLSWLFPSIKMVLVSCSHRQGRGALLRCHGVGLWL